MKHYKETINSGIGTLLSDSIRFSSNKGEISMLTPCESTRGQYEIFSTEGNLFEDIERYWSIEEVQARINELLD